MNRNSKFKIVAGLSGLFSALVVLVIVLVVRQVISFQMALLMLIGLLGLYFGFGILFAVYRFVVKLD